MELLAGLAFFASLSWGPGPLTTLISTYVPALPLCMEGTHSLLLGQLWLAGLSRLWSLLFLRSGVISSMMDCREEGDIDLSKMPLKVVMA